MSNETPKKEEKQATTETLDSNSIEQKAGYDQHTNLFKF